MMHVRVCVLVSALHGTVAVEAVLFSCDISVIFVLNMLCYVPLLYYVHKMGSFVLRLIYPMYRLPQGITYTF